MHASFLQAALKQAWLGRGKAAPNPAVGAVAVLNEKIIAQAFHQGVGHLHAEQALFQALPSDCSHITLYVTLEPCNHWGRTPPCVEGIVERKFKQVVYAYRDPNPLVSANNTPEILQSHGIDVLHYALPEIDAFYESYAFWTRTGRPWVTVKVAQSLDGKIAGKDGEQIQLSNAACAEFTHQERLHTDVILTTAKTIIKDNPQLNARINDEIISKPVAILDRNNTLASSAQIHQTAEKIHHYDARFDIEAVLEDLGRKGYHDVWVEAGGMLFSTLHAKALVQRTHLYLVPKALGRNATPLYHEAFCLTDAKKTTYEILDDNVKLTFDWEAACSQA